MQNLRGRGVRTSIRLLCIRPCIYPHDSEIFIQAVLLENIPIIRKCCAQNNWLLIRNQTKMLRLFQFKRNSKMAPLLAAFAPQQQMAPPYLTCILPACFTLSVVVITNGGAYTGLTREWQAEISRNREFLPCDIGECFDSISRR